MRKKNVFYFVCVFLGNVALVLLIMTGCQKSSLTEPEFNTAEVDNADIAVSIAELICEDNGGVLDQVGDVIAMASPEGHQILTKSAGIQNTSSHTATYDSLTQTWNIEVSREHGTPGDSIYAKFERTYLKQFLNKNGLPQKFWKTQGDTAYSIDFDLVDGTGLILRPHFSHHLKSIDGEWLATNTNTEMVTINGNFHRAAIDTLTRERGTRISDHSVDLSINNVNGPRGSRRDLSQKVSGSITGVFQVTVTIIRENITIVKEVERDINIQLGNGEVNIQVGQDHFKVHPQNGNLIE